VFNLGVLLYPTLFIIARITFCYDFTHLPAGYPYNAYWTRGASDALIVAKNILSILRINQSHNGPCPLRS
jgi:hypothetical protein